MRDLRRLWLAALALALLTPSGCAGRACEEQPPSMEVNLTLGADVVVADIARIRVQVSAAGQAKTSEMDSALLKSNRRASFVVVVGEAGAGGFDAQVTVELLASGGQVIALARDTYAGSGDGCNILSMRLSSGLLSPDGSVQEGGTADGGVDGEVSCHAGNCTGCCQPDGQCASGTLNTLCGKGGVVCTDCTLELGGTCEGGACTGCTPVCTGKICGEADGCGGTCAAGSGCTAVIYAWVTGDWGGCSANCDGGTQSRAVTCQATPGGTVADSNCAGTKPATSQACNTQDCCTADPLVVGRRCNEENLAAQWIDFGTNTGSAADRDACAAQCMSYAISNGKTEWCCHLYEDSSPGTTWVCRPYWTYSTFSSGSVSAGLGRCEAP